MSLNLIVQAKIFCFVNFLLCNIKNSCPYSHKMRLIGIEREVISSSLCDNLLAGHVTLIQLNNRLCYFNRGESNTGHNHIWCTHRFRKTYDKAYNDRMLYSIIIL